MRLAGFLVGFKVVAAGLMVLSVALPSLAADAVDTAQPGVLILHSNQRPTVLSVVVDNTLRESVPKGVGSPVQLYSEYLDAEWASLQKHAASEAEFLRGKYDGRNIQVVVAVSPAASFATEFHDRMFPGVPVVMISVPHDRMDPGTLPNYAVGVFDDYEPTPTLQLALRLHPDARRLVAIRGASETDPLWDTRVRDAVERLGGDLEVEYLAGLPTAAVLQRVAALPRGTIVYTPGYYIDGAGNLTTPAESIKPIARASTVPVYGAYNSQLGSGIVGGYMHRFEDEAMEGVAKVVRLLQGATPAEIGTSIAARMPIVDWRQVRRWHIDESLLPPGTIVMFREPTAWDKYGVEISIGTALLLLQAALIAALLIERRTRRRTAAALGESQQQMNLATTAARLSPWIWDASEKKVEPGSRRPKGTERLKGKSVPFEEVIDSVHPLDRDNLRRVVWRALRTGNELDVEYRLVDGDAGVRWIAARGRAEEGDSQRLLGVALDITERKAAEMRAAEDRNALRHVTRVSTMGQLSAAIAHQLNQPLAAILGNAETAQKMLARGRPDLTELSAICDDIVSEDHRASNVIRRLSDLYKRGDMKMEPLDLNELIRETLDLLHTELLVRHIAPVAELATGLPAIEGAGIQLQQVVLNLVLNAADAMNQVEPEHRKLTLRTRFSETDVRLDVIDNGPGIPAEHLGTIFDPFWTTKAAGMGMGLAICQSIVASHRGRITAANNPGGGATFSVLLPARQSTSP
jgi:signal transduction histidine kinase